jgi:putative ubiquitin-RnfH superfamily antitoxin RatB of RatAB toxin-antitoxin module
MAQPAEIRAVVLYSPAPRTMHEWPVVLAPGSTVLQALQASGLQTSFPDLDLRRAVLGIWAREARREQIVRDGDRIEIYRPLKVDPKLARRERFRRQGVRAAGLFARKKNGPRPGY